MLKFDKPAEKLFCENCYDFVEYEIVRREETYNVRGDEITITAEVPVCKRCGAELSDIHLENKKLRKAYRIYAKRHGLVTPEQIKEIRKKYGLNQELFARILGISRPRLARYENGSLPSEAVSNLIEQAEDPKFLLSLLEDRKDNLAKVDYERIKNKIERSIVKRKLEELEEAFSMLNRGRVKFQKTVRHSRLYS